MYELVEVKTEELKGAALDWMVAEVTGQPKTILKGKPYALFGSLALPFNDPEKGYSPSSCWHCCGPLIEEERVACDFSRPVAPGDATLWFAQVWQPYGNGSGSSPLIAACRAIVAAKLGEVVQVPVELLPC